MGGEVGEGGGGLGGVGRLGGVGGLGCGGWGVSWAGSGPVSIWGLTALPTLELVPKDRVSTRATAVAAA